MLVFLDTTASSKAVSCHVVCHFCFYLAEYSVRSIIQGLGFFPKRTEDKSWLLFAQQVFLRRQLMCSWLPCLGQEPGEML